MFNFEKELIELAYEAGRKIMEVYNTDFEFEIKSDNSPLTLADQIANKIIVSKIQQLFPKHSILSEEEKDSISRFSNRYVWIIDPLDGTKEFINRNGQFTVNIALCEDNKPIFGVIYQPTEDVLYYATKGKGAYKISNAITSKINVSSRVDNLIMIGSKSHASIQEETIFLKNQNKISEKLNAGSSLKGCLVAEGKADLYYRFGLTSEWDICAMNIIVEEAGGIMRQMDHSEITYNRADILNRKGFYVLNRIDNFFNYED